MNAIQQTRYYMYIYYHLKAFYVYTLFTLRRDMKEHGYVSRELSRTYKPLHPSPSSTRFQKGNQTFKLECHLGHPKSSSDMPRRLLHPTSRHAYTKSNLWKREAVGEFSSLLYDVSI